MRDSEPRGSKRCYDTMLGLPGDRGIEAETTELGTVPVALPEDSEGLPSSPDCTCTKAIDNEPRKGSLVTDEPARGVPC